ncbi:MAG: hypothetical protein S4CHLAM6_13420 [Chlamydiae bacterium]|nr:hypothetical protein [Chlamydiota bacterium]
MLTKLLSKVEKILKKEDLECFVLMVCNKSETTDEIFVEMTYDGDEVLGCYMLENARAIMGQKINKTETDTPENESLT